MEDEFKFMGVEQRGSYIRLIKLGILECRKDIEFYKGLLKVNLKNEGGKMILKMLG